MTGNWLFKITCSLLFSYLVKACCKTETALIHILTEWIYWFRLNISRTEVIFPPTVILLNPLMWFTDLSVGPDTPGFYFLQKWAYVQSPEDIVWVILAGNSLLKFVILLIAHLQNKLPEESRWKYFKWQMEHSPKLNGKWSVILTSC